MSATSLPSTPSVRRRLIAMVYETFLVASVNALAVGVWMLLTLNSQTPMARIGMNIFLFLVTGAYFVHSWTGSGHTLAMKTWRIRLARADTGGRVTMRSAILRYLLAWGWVLPALVACGLRGPKSWSQVGITMGVGILGWALTAFLDRDRQFLHDRLLGTRLVSLPKRGAATPAATNAA
jgi:uncharacterized RDD family membrane protein YckC